MGTDFRYNTGATRVPWAAVGENYNAHDLMEIIKFLMQGEGKEYEDAICPVIGSTVPTRPTVCRV